MTLYSFIAYASGDYVDPDWNEPDPESPDYPASGTAPGPSYGDAQSVKAMVQPISVGQSSAGESLVRTPWGEEVKVSLKAYFPYDVTVAHRDRITYGGVNHLVVGIGEWYDEGDLVFRKVLLKEEVA